MININGTILEKKEAKLSVLNRGFSYGDSVFETIRVINGKIMFWEDHYFRLMSSMRIMRMEIPSNFSPEFLEKEISDIIQANELENDPVRVRFSVYRKQGGYYLPATREIGYLINVEKMENAFYLLTENFYEVELFKDHYVNSGLLSTIKSNNRAVNVLGSIFASENNYHNCLLLNEKKQVVETLNGNLFLVKDNSIKTPPLSDGVLNGIIRKQLLGIIAKTEDYKLEEASISPFELQKADELFITNVAVGIQSISKYRKKEYTNKIAKDLLGKLNVQARLN